MDEKKNSRKVWLLKFSEDHSSNNPFIFDDAVKKIAVGQEYELIDWKFPRQNFEPVKKIKEYAKSNMKVNDQVFLFKDEGIFCHGFIKELEESNNSIKKIDFDYIVPYSESLSKDKISEANISNKLGDFESFEETDYSELVEMWYKHLININYIQTLQKQYQRIQNADNKIKHSDKNLILYGPPGTGKTYHTALYALAICENKSLDMIKKEIEDEDREKEKEKYGALMERFRDYMNDETNPRIAFTTFHQSYGYEEFIEGIKPVLAGNNSTDSPNKDIAFKLEDGVFKAFCEKARDDKDNNYVFIIDEINRGNIAKIFGELITLIEDTKREGKPEAATTILPYSKESFSVPSNVYVIGTMNTADRSIMQLDTALRRRFRFVEMMPNPKLLEGITIKAIEEGKEKTISIKTMLETMNKRIEALYDREHTIGHSYFLKLKDGPTIEKLAAIFKKDILPLLQEYFYEDYEKIQLVLGDNAKNNNDRFIKNETRTDIFMKNIDKKDEYTDESSIKIYEINNAAFDKPQSYIDIYETKENEAKGQA